MTDHELRTDLDSKTRALAEREKECERLKQKLDTWTDQVASEHARWLRERDTLRAQLADLTQRLTKYRSEIEGIDARRDWAERNSARIQAECEARLIAYQQEAAQWKQGIQSQLAEAQRENQRLRDNNEADAIYLDEVARWLGVDRKGALSPIGHAAQDLRSRLTACEPVVEAVRKFQALVESSDRLYDIDCGNEEYLNSVAAVKRQRALLQTIALPAKVTT